MSALPFRLARRVPEQGGYGVPRPKILADDLLRLDSNEGRAPAAWLRDTLRDADPALLQRYPDPTGLRRAIARREGTDENTILLTAGGDEALERLCKLVLQPGRSAILPTPTFEMIERYAGLAEGELHTVPWTRGAFPTGAVLDAVDATTAAIFIVSPNNPTGLVATPADVARLAAAAPEVLLVFDLAYTEFADDDLAPLVRDLPNAVAVRTLSKAWGLAGLRIGWTAGPPATLRALGALGGPYSVSAPSLYLAERWLAEGDAPTRDYVAAVRAERDALRAVLLAGGAQAEPSQGNFVLARFSGDAARAAHVHGALAAEHILVRAWPDRPGLDDALRITCPGDEAAFARLCSALARLLRSNHRLGDPS